MLHGACVGEEAGARNLVFFRVQWLQAAMKGTSCVRRVRLGSFRTRLAPPLCSAKSGCSCACGAKRIVVAASRLRGTTAACVILLSFAAEAPK